MSDILAPDVLRRIDVFYDTTLKPKLAAIDDRRRHVRWLIVKSLIIVLPPIGVLIAGDLLDGILPFTSGVGTMVAAGLWLVAGLVFVLMRYFLPGVTAYANYRSRFKQDIVADIFKVVFPLGAYDPLQGISKDVFDAAGLFSTRGSFECDDRVRGRIGLTPFEGSEVGRAYSTGSGKNSRSYVVFRGLFFHLGFHRRLSGVTVIDPTQAHAYQIGKRDGLSRLALGTPAFEKAFTVHASNEAEARALLTPAMMEQLLTVHRHVGQPVFAAFRDRRAFVGVHYGRTLFEPGVAQSTSKEAVREIAEHFALVETIVRELNRDAPATEADETWFHGPDVEPHVLSRLAAERAGTLTPSDLWAAASASIDDAAKDGGAPAPRPHGSRIRLERGPGELSITYGLRVGFWVILAISLGGALLAASALRAPKAPASLGPASEWVRTLPPIPWLDAFAADAPIPWLIVGTVVAVLFALGWTGAVRRVVIDGDRIRIHRGLRPVPRVYSRTQYGRVIRVRTRLYVAKRGNVRLMNPTASPGLTEPEARWLAAEMKRALGQA